MPTRRVSLSFAGTRRRLFSARRRNAAAWTLGRWVAAGALKQRDVEDALYNAPEPQWMVHDDGDRQCWATIRRGLSAGLMNQRTRSRIRTRAPSVLSHLRCIGAELLAISSRTRR